MRFGYGLLTCQRPPDDARTDAELYNEVVERCVAAEAAGFDSVWTSEHHFVDDGYMPSLLVMCAAIAQATTRVEVGTAILLAPLHDPVRLAEDAATVDLLSNGRLVLGIGAGWREEEFEAFGVDLAARAGRMRETVAILKGAWGPGPFSHDGKHYRYDNLNVTPKPSRDIPVWMGAFAAPAQARAGRIADGFLGSSSGTQGIPAFVRTKEIVTEARTTAGKPLDGFAFALHVPVYVGDWQDVLPYYGYLRWKYGDMAQARGSAVAAAAPTPGAEQAEQLRGSIICGEPDEVVDQIGAYRDALGPDIHFICRSDFPGMPRAQQFALIERIGADVLPQLR